MWEGNNYYRQAVWGIHVQTSETLGDWTDQGWFSFNPSVGTPQWAGLPQVTPARYVYWAWYEDDGNGHSAHLYEIAYTGIPTPEPAAWAVLAPGLAAVAWLRRRRLMPF